jgi:prepilin-type N-terminal cleavage/methylation domain-containing protein
MSYRARAGVTLMELLIAVSLVALLSTGIVFAMRVGLTALDRSSALLEANRKVAGVQRVIERQVAGFMPVVADCRSAPGAPAERRMFFHGEPQAMRFVSSYSLEEAARGYPRILEYLVIPGENGRGVRLVVNELLYSGPESTGALCLGGTPPRYPPVTASPRSFVLADRLAYCRLAYQEAMPMPQPRRWTGAWISPELPVALRFEMAPLERGGGLALGTITLPIRASRSAQLWYAD